MEKKNWIQGAIKRPGAFTAKAKAKGMTASKFGKVVRKNPDKYSERTVRQANLAKTLAKFQAGGNQYALPTSANATTTNLMGLGDPAQLSQKLAISNKNLAEQNASMKNIEEMREKDAEQASKMEFNQGLTKSAQGLKDVLPGVKDATQIALGTANAAQVAKASKDTAGLLSNLNNFGSAANTAKGIGAGLKAAGPGGLGAGLSLVGTGIERASDDKDATTMNFGETSGKLLKGAGTGLGVAGALGALGATGFGLPLALVGAAGYGIHGLIKRNKARKEQGEEDAQNKAAQEALSREQTNAFNQSFTKTGTDMGFNVGNSATNSYLPSNQMMYKQGGEMIKRADGSYSQRGLWDNIRANKGSGKKPTKQMLEQERKIKGKMQAGNSPVAVATPPKNVTTQNLTPSSNFTQRLREHNLAPDSTFENAAEFFDVSGVSSWDDAYRAYNSMQNRGASTPNLSEAIDMFGAIPVLGKLGRAGSGIKLAKKSFNWQEAINRADAVSDEVDQKKKGGYIKPLPGGAVEFVGPKHSKGGIKLDAQTEVEGGETMDKVKFTKGGNAGDYIFSDYLKLGGKSFAKRHKEVVNKGGSQAEIQTLAKLQEAVAKKKGRDENGPRGPEFIAQSGGVRKYQTGNPPTNESYSDVNFDYRYQPKNEGNIPMHGDVNEANWQNVFNTPWAQRLGLDRNMSQKDLETYYEQTYKPMIANMPDDVLVDRARQFANSGDENAKYIARQFNPNGSIKPNGLAELRRLATDTQVGPYHAIFIDPPKQETPPVETPPEENEIPTSQTTKETPDDKELAPEARKRKYRPEYLSLLGLAGLGVPVKDPYPKARLASAATTRGVNLPRINLNAERAANAAQNTAFNRAMMNQASGPGSVAAMLAAGEGAREQNLRIASQESTANKQLMGEEAGMNANIAAQNAGRMQEASMFNARQLQERDTNQYDQRLLNRQLRADTLTGVGRDFMSYRAQERLADAVDDTGSYLRFVGDRAINLLNQDPSAKQQLSNEITQGETTKAPTVKQKSGGYIKKFNSVKKRRK